MYIPLFPYASYRFPSCSIYLLGAADAGLLLVTDAVLGARLNGGRDHNPICGVLAVKDRCSLLQGTVLRLDEIYR